MKQVALVPFSPRLGSFEKNIQQIEIIIKDILVGNKVDMIIFPELSTSGYVLESLTAETARRVTDPAFEPVLKLSLQTDVILGHLISDHNRFYNGGLHFSKGQVSHTQRKLYPPTYGMFDEKRYMSSGEDLYAFNTSIGQCGLLICEDAWHPYLAFLLSCQKVENVIVISASPGRAPLYADQNLTSFEMWQKRFQVYAQSFGMRFLYINRSGSEDGIYFDGTGIFTNAAGEQTVFMDKEYYILNIDDGDFYRARAAGGPFQEQSLALSERLFHQTLNFRGDK